MMISFVVALIALVVVSAMAVEMTDHQLAFYLRGAQEQHFINEVWQEDAMFWQRQMKEYDSLSSNRRRLEAESSMLSMS